MTTTSEKASTTYTRNQAQLAASPAGILAATMTPGTRWLTPSGVVVTVWKSWAPDLTGEAEKVASRYGWAQPDPAHNTEIGVSSRERGTERIRVADVGEWRAAT